MRLTIEFAFDAAHQILGHPGRCAYLHGHTYRVEVTVSAERLDRLGMVIDFDDLKALVKKAMLDRWDHTTLLWSEDPPRWPGSRHRLVGFHDYLLDKWLLEGRAEGAVLSTRRRILSREPEPIGDGPLDSR